MISELTIITINLNNKIGLEQTILSVINQSYKNFEYIIVDGKSTDGSFEVITKYSEVITQWISEPDNGIYHAMNKGIRMSSGKYLLFLNSGDILVCNEVLKEIFSIDHNADFLCGKANIYNKGKIIHVTDPPQYHTFSTYFNSTINHQATFIKRILFEKFGYYREDFQINSDWEFWIRTIILNNCSTEKLNILVANYNTEGISSDLKNEYIAKKEIENVLSNPILARFVPDYNQWEKEKEENKVLQWIKKASVVYNIALLIFNLVKLSKKLRYISFILTTLRKI